MSRDFQSLNRCLAAAQPSATYRIIDRVAARRAEGARIISLCAGEPDFDTPQHIRQAAIAAIEAGHTRYTQVAGLRALREAVAAKYRDENGLAVSWEDTQVSSGGKQVIYNALAATLNEGDEVIIPAPYWVSYPEMVQLCGGRSRIVSCGADSGFKLTAEALREAIGPDTRWLILNSPSNPTGAVYSREELRALAGVLLEHPQVLILSDDIYEHLIFDGQQFHTLAQVEPRLAERTLTMNGVSKAYAMTGWRIGYAGGPRPVIAAMNALQSQSTSNASSVSQYAALAALTQHDETARFTEQARRAYRARRDRIVAGLNALGLPTPTPQGAFYVMANTTRIHSDELEAARRLLDEARVAVVPGTDFAAPGQVRLSYATSMERIEEVLRRIGAVVGA